MLHDYDGLAASAYEYSYGVEIGRGVETRLALLLTRVWRCIVGLLESGRCVAAVNMF